MEKRSINPSPWLLEFGINHGEVTRDQRVSMVTRFDGSIFTFSDGAYWLFLSLATLPGDEATRLSGSLKAKPLGSRLRPQL